MQLSQRPLNQTLQNQLRSMLLGLFSEAKTPDEVASAFESLLTEGERTAILKRLGIALYLDKGRSYEDIKNNIKVSSATIASVAENLGNEGWQTIVRKIKADEWASEWSGKIAGKLKRFLG